MLAVIEAARLPGRCRRCRGGSGPEPAETELLRKLAQLTQQTGRELGIAPEILATRRDMQRLVDGARDGGPLSGWRRAVIGERLLQAPVRTVYDALRSSRLAAGSDSSSAISRRVTSSTLALALMVRSRPLGGVVLRQRTRLLLVDLEPPAHRGFLVVGPLHQHRLVIAHVAARRAYPRRGVNIEYPAALSGRCGARRCA